MNSKNVPCIYYSSELVFIILPRASNTLAFARKIDATNSLVFALLGLIRSNSLKYVRNHQHHLDEDDDADDYDFIINFMMI